MSTQPALFISHGSPQIILDNSAAHDFLKSLGGLLIKPKAILVISAHWETHGLKIMATENPKTIYDFGGFDPKLYQMTYPAKGNPELAEHIHSLLAENGIGASIDTLRGLDHGAWIPLTLIYPDADIPTLQISIPKGANPSEVFAIGKALSVLRDKNILIIGSGSLTHNLYEFRGQGLDDTPPAWVTNFADWVQQKLAEGDMGALLDYRQKAPFARENHPTEEHFLPLFVALGAGNGENIKSLHRSYNHSILAMDAYSIGTP